DRGVSGGEGARHELRRHDRRRRAEALPLELLPGLADAGFTAEAQRRRAEMNGGMDERRSGRSLFNLPVFHTSALPFTLCASAVQADPNWNENSFAPRATTRRRTGLPASEA